MTIDLTQFCNPNRLGMGRPWTRNGFTWATDARVIVRVEPEPFGDSAIAPNTGEVMKLYKEKGAFEPLPELPKEALRCDNCSGQGKWKDGTTCDECDGDGLGATSCKIADRWFDLIFLQKMATLPSIEINKAGKPLDGMSFRFTGGIGILMPLKAPITGSKEVIL